MARDRSRSAAQAIFPLGAVLIGGLASLSLGYVWWGIGVVAVALVGFGMIVLFAKRARDAAKQPPPRGSRRAGHWNR